MVQEIHRNDDGELLLTDSADDNPILDADGAPVKNIADLADINHADPDPLTVEAVRARVDGGTDTNLDRIISQDRSRSHVDLEEFTGDNQPRTADDFLYTTDVYVAADEDEAFG